MMRRLMLPVVTVFLLLWLGLGSWWYSLNYCGAAGLAAAPGLTITDGPHQIKAAETFSFYKSSEDPIMPQSTAKAFEQLSMYLLDHPDKRLRLYGMSSTDESNHTRYENLGKARAEALRERLIGLGVPPGAVLTKGVLVENASFADGIMYGGVYFDLFQINDKPSLNPSAGAIGSIDVFKPVHIYFDPNEYDILLSDELQQYLDEVKIYLRKNPSARIAIIGHADQSATQSATLQLSETRARNVKKFMLRSGFDAKRLLLEFKKENTSTDPGDPTYDPDKNSKIELRLITG